MGIFSDIPIRHNSSDGTIIVDASWWNTIRTALVAYFGGGATGETNFTIADNQSTYADVTGLSFDGATYGYVKIEYDIYRFDAAADERKESGTLILNHKKGAATWGLSRYSDGDDALGIANSFALDVTAGVAQVQYKSDSMGGTYEGVMVHRISSTFNVAP